jgi:holo-[acyl-carrier protein] synthase
MIVGIGTDIVHIPRIANVLMYKRERFVKRILTPAEIIMLDNSAKPDEFLAARFAAKEAAAKALGTGFRNGVSYLQIAVQWEAMGKPSLVFTGKAEQVALELQVTAAHLSITHEREYAVAFVVLENN